MSVWLVCIVHGSRDPAWRAPIEALVSEVAARTKQQVHLAYMDYAPPRLLEVATRAAEAGASELRVWPLFMSGGGHVEHDIPAQVQQVRDAMPRLPIKLLPPLGTHARFVEFVCVLAEELIA